MRQPACLVFSPIMADNYAAGESGVRLYDGPDKKLFILVGLGRSFLSVTWPTGVQLVFFSIAPGSGSYLAPRDLHRRVAY